nr:hypothetical protein Itr_chr03CG08920 [Ipomoea trifida]
MPMSMERNVATDFIALPTSEKLSCSPNVGKAELATGGGVNEGNLPLEMDGWVPRNSIFAAKALVFIAVHLSNENRFRLLETCSKLYILESKLFTVTTPGGVEFDENVSIMADFLLEVVLGKEDFP